MSFETPLPPYASSDPSATFLNASCFELLMIEMVPMAFRIADDLSRPPSYERTLLLDGENGAGGAGKNTKGSVEGNGGGKGKGSMDGKGGGSANGEEEGEERRREMVRRRLEGVGYRVGLGIVERFVDSPPLPFPILVPAGGAEQAPFAKGECGRGMHILLSTHEWSAYGFIYKLAVPEQLAGRGTSWRRHIRLTVPGFMGDSFSRDRPRFADTLDMIKFLCKDVWTLVFRKQIDNLKTNHRGVYVLTDNAFRPLARMSTASPAEAVGRAQPFLWFPSGIIRGALAAMGLQATVHAESSDLPGVVFQIKTVGAKM